MMNLVLRRCFNFKLVQSQKGIFKQVSPSCRYLCSEGSKQLTRINKNKEIKGYFVEDFNVKGKLIWEYTTKGLTAGIIYVVTSTISAVFCVYLMKTPYTFEIIDYLNLMDKISRFNISDDQNIKTLLTFALFMLIQPFCWLAAYRQSRRLRDYLHSKGRINNAKFRRFKGEKSYDEEKVGRF